MRPPRPSELFRIIRAFADWSRLLSDYAGVRSPARRYELRSGRIVETHAVDRADVATLFVIFGRLDYGRVPDDAVVLDIGANIGAFAVYAAEQGAHVYSFEPEPSNYSLLLSNVPPSVKTFEAAVTSRVEQRSLFIRSSPAHSLYPRREEDSLMVDCVSLGAAMERCGLHEIDLLKLDAEGSEYEILYGGAEALAAVKEIRMEYHHLAGTPPDWRIEGLQVYLGELGFSRTLLRPINESCGTAWFRRS